MKFIFVLILVSCGMIRFDPNGVDHEKLVTKNTPEEGCFRDVDCAYGKVCATVRGGYPGSCADPAGNGLLIGAAFLGAAALAIGQGASNGPAPASQPANNSYHSNDHRGCCSYHSGINSCGGFKIICNDGWTSGCDC